MSAMNQLLGMLQAAVDTKAVTVADLAAHAGISRQHVYNILHQKSVPTLDIAEALADCIGMSLRLSPEKKPEKVSA